MASEVGITLTNCWDQYIFSVFLLQIAMHEAAVAAATSKPTVKPHPYPAVQGMVRSHLFETPYTFKANALSSVKSSNATQGAFIAWQPISKSRSTQAPFAKISLVLYCIDKHACQRRPLLSNFQALLWAQVSKICCMHLLEISRPDSVFHFLIQTRSVMQDNFLWLIKKEPNCSIFARQNSLLEAKVFAPIWCTDKALVSSHRDWLACIHLQVTKILLPACFFPSGIRNVVASVSHQILIFALTLGIQIWSWILITWPSSPDP